MNNRLARARFVWAALVLGLVVAPLVAGGTALAAPTPSSTSTAATAAPTPVMVVLDASGSMNQTDAPGSRIEAAKTAVRGLVEALPAGAQVGLEVFGTSTGSSEAEKTAGCADITVPIPVGPVDATAFTGRVDAITARGYTPIGASLRTAVQNLPTEGARSVVLVSDGEDTCAPPPPCDVARELEAQGVTLTVDTIGFKVDDAARAQLQCIAAATGGTYRDAQDGAALASTLDERVSRAVEPYATTGTPITGAPTPAGAPALEAGQYLDTVPRTAGGAGTGDAAQWYDVQLAQGQTPYFSATAVPLAVPVTDVIVNVMSVGLTLVSADDPDCSFRDYGVTTGTQGKNLTTTGVLAPGEVGGSDWPPACPTSGTFHLGLVRQEGPADVLALELAFRVEPPADSSGLPGPADTAKLVPVPDPATTVTPQDAGTGFNDAPLVGPGTVADTITSGESRYYRVHLDWGQRLAARVDTPAVAGVDILDGSTAQLDLASPVRESLDDVRAQSGSVAAFVGAQAQTFSASTTVPARWSNRTSSSTLVQQYALDGDYFVVVSNGYARGGTPGTSTYTLTVAVSGQSEDGPAYATVPDAGDSPTATASTEPTAAVPTAVTATSSVRTAGSVFDLTSGSPVPYLVWGLVAVAVLGLGRTLWLVRRR